MSKESSYKPASFGSALFFAFLLFVVLAIAGLVLWGVVALFATHPVFAFLLVTGLVAFVGVAYLVHYLDTKYEWGLLEEFSTSSSYDYDDDNYGW